MRRRPSARLIVLDAQNRVLLFRFAHKSGALAGQDYWATPGGGLDPGESFIDAARRELAEETGFKTDIIEPHVAEREFILQFSDGEHVIAEERFFVARTADNALSTESWTAEEVEVMADHRWWTLHELRTTAETVFPENMAKMVAGLVAA
ncbi:NUDIX hydrolase [Microvirga terricola]|uniref:NUDIX domain-containing protein n=1 Tax=Microvirga terricola TaxID=2719797 RepID=A0ABX0VBP1_9HYPH|nr:NUDIX domain-containing protein [Microvirga terricola]NIX77092.1 NUDIX domain-containing protein [Microvirga terricola]